VIAIDHDQGQIATKLKGLDRGATVTAGLETVFTTPSHGTAFDIAGKGVARTGALENVIRLAAQLAHVKLREDSMSPADRGISSMRSVKRSVSA
jgi:4-hydroxythreonine-4-phosphate dehydrogenase